MVSHFAVLVAESWETGLPARGQEISRPEFHYIYVRTHGQLLNLLHPTLSLHAFQSADQGLDYPMCKEASEQPKMLPLHQLVV